MHPRLLLGVMVLLVISAALVMSLGGCSRGTPEPSSILSSSSEDASESSHQETSTLAESVNPARAVVSESEMKGSATEDPELLAESTSSASEEMPVQLILTWTRDAGALRHCDQLTIDSHGQVVATICADKIVDSTVLNALTGEQLTRLQGWVANYASFTRREVTDELAVRTTTFVGSGVMIPTSSAKTEIAAFAAELFLELAETE